MHQYSTQPKILKGIKTRCALTSSAIAVALSSAAAIANDVLFLDISETGGGVFFDHNGGQFATADTDNWDDGLQAEFAFAGANVTVSVTAEARVFGSSSAYEGHLLIQAVDSSTAPADELPTAYAGIGFEFGPLMYPADLEQNSSSVWMRVPRNLPYQVWIASGFAGWQDRLVFIGHGTGKFERTQAPLAPSGVAGSFDPNADTIRLAVVLTDLLASEQETNRLRLREVCLTTNLMCSPADLEQPHGVLDFSDILSFLLAFNAMQPEADIESPIGIIDFSDAVAFVTAFSDGCP